MSEVSSEPRAAQAAKSASSPAGKVIGFGMLGLGLLALVAGAWKVVDESRLGGGTKATAAVTEARVDTKGNNAAFQVRYKFAAADGKEYTASERLPWPSSDLWVELRGDAAERAKKEKLVDVVYLPGSPSVNRPAEPVDSPTWAGIKIALIGLVGIGIGAVALKPSHKPAPAA
ncbi:MAG TPA: hypothetical protein VF796_20375 [Humisphaera sp.]